MNLNSDIGWPTATWNPVTGCQHGEDICACSKKCFARTIANRFGGYIVTKENEKEFLKDIHALDTPERIMDKAGKIRKAAFPFCFDPTFHRYRLGEPAAVKKSQNIFTVDMGDLFGAWVPDEWIWEVADACAAAPQNNYLFLTKNPKRYYTVTDRGILGAKFTLIAKACDRENIWFGVSATNKFTADEALLHLREVDYFANTFLSIEPLLGWLEHIEMDIRYVNPNWVIVGAMTGPGAAAHQPRREWVQAIVDQCRSAGVPVFLKNNLWEIWGEDLIQEFPDGLREVAEANRK